MTQGRFRKTLVREAALLFGLLFFGFVVVPILIYWVGPNLLGDFGGVGYSDFFNTLSARVRGGDVAAWFFILSPYCTVQALRLAWRGWRAL